MTDTIKEKSFYEAQKYVATQEWLDIQSEVDQKIEDLKDYILEDSILPQSITLSKNMMRWLGKELELRYVDRINNDHLKKVLLYIVKDNEERLLIPEEESCDILKFSEKDWARRERRILQYISDFGRIYWQDKETDNNESVEAWLNSLSQGIFL